jgi:hypothetical protein
MQHHFEILEYAKARQNELRASAAADRRADALRGDAPSRLGGLARRAVATLAGRFGERRAAMRRPSAC